MFRKIKIAISRTTNNMQTVHSKHRAATQTAKEPAPTAFAKHHSTEGPMGANSHVQPATWRDMPKILEFIKKGVKEGKLLPRNENEIIEDIRKGNAFLYKDGTKTSGMVFLDVYSEKLAELRSLYVAAGHRSNGVGSALIDKAKERARELGVMEVMTITRKGSDEWFRQFGFGEPHDFRVPLFLKLRDA